MVLASGFTKVKDLNCTTGMSEPKTMEEAVQRVKDILDAKCAPMSSEQIVDNSPHLTDEHQQSLLVMLKKHVSLFDGTLGR